MGVLPGLKAFVAAVLGGIGNIPGAALGGLLLGVVETFVNGSEWSTYKDAIAFALLILVLLFRPAGLLGRFTKEKV
jgi:branched-chain amino acid transport system permease protein